MILNSYYHSPVLLPEMIRILKVNSGKKYIDATVGGGGYSKEILKHGGVVLGIDYDSNALDYLGSFQWGARLVLVKGNFRDIEKIARNNGFEQPDGIIFDLGLSSYQLEKSGRGFSYLKNEPLDMRADADLKLNASDILNSYSKENLYEIFTKNAEEINSWPIAVTIVGARSLKKGNRTWNSEKLLEVISRAIKNESGVTVERKVLYKTAARIYQALRMEVNNESDNLKYGIAGSLNLLNPGGILSVISYHSVEDRIVKRCFESAVEGGTFRKPNGKHPIFPSYREKMENPKSRSARMRILEKL